jgi:16S rRNA (guanine966-N2)-methyltransferase
MRVIAGALGGRRLVAPKGRDTRPTADRVREALFAALDSVEGARVLDLYAGSGALAIEALSRGAKHAVLVEQSVHALRALRENLAALELDDRCKVYRTSVERALHALRHERFDLVLVDPPYAEIEAAARIVERLVRAGVCATEARIVLEHAARSEAPRLTGAELTRTRRYGDSAISIYVVTAPLAAD